MLESAVEKKRKQKADEEFKSLTGDLVKEIASSVAPDDVSNAIVDRLEKAISPVMERLMEKDRVTTEDITRAISEMQLKMPEINVPEMKMPVINVPQPKVTVNVPKITVPDIIMPKEMETRGWLGIMGYDKGLLQDPIPVQVRDASGKPIDFGASMLSISSGGGGKHDFFTIKGFSQSAFSELQNPDGRLKVELPTGTSGLTDAELRATAVPVSQVSGANWSVSVADIFGSTGANIINPDNRIKVELPTGTSGLTDAELRATAVPVSQVSGANWSTEVTNTVTVDGSGVTQPVSATNLDIRDLVNASDSVAAYQVSGASWSTEATQAGTWNIGTVTTVTGITNSIAAALIDSSGVQYSTQNPLPIDDAGGSITIDGTVAVSGITGTLGTNIVDSSGVGYSGSNPVPITIISGALTSTISVGDTLHDAADIGAAPVKVGGVAMQTNPTAVADGDRVNFRGDDLGRQLVRPFQVRDLTKTAWVQISNGTETTLRAAVAGAFLDLVYIVGANNSDAAVSVDIRPVTAGNVVLTLMLPAYGTAGIACPLPLPQQDTGNNWTADMGDITGTTVSLTALFSQEV